MTPIRSTTLPQAASLLALRVSLGFLMIWWGLSKLFVPKVAMTVQKKFYWDLFGSTDLQFYFGIVQVVVGVLVVIGLFRLFAMVAQMGIVLFSASAIWPALLDPFALWLPMEKVSGMQHLFYPTVVCLCGGLVMLAFRSVDTLNVDTVLRRRRVSVPPVPAMTPAE